jgi:proline racemase
MTFKRMIHAVETHSGEPMRVITGGVPSIPGDSVHEQMKWLEENDDQIRMLMLREPRGYPPLCCNLVVPPKHPDAAAGYIIMEQVEYPVMSGGNTIAVATVLLETGMVPMKEPCTEFTLEAPAGLIGIRAECRGGKVKQVTFENVPAFAAYLDAVIDVPELGKVTVDVGWGGMFYVIADVRQFAGLQLVPATVGRSPGSAPSSCGPHKISCLSRTPTTRESGSRSPSCPGPRTTRQPT